MTGSLCWASQGTSPSGTVPFYLDKMNVSMHVCLIGLYPCTYSHSTHEKFSHCVFKNTDVLDKYSTMEVWWCIVSRDKERDKKKKPLAQEKEKNFIHSLTDMRAWSFSHAGVTNLSLSLL